MIIMTTTKETKHEREAAREREYYSADEFGEDAEVDYDVDEAEDGDE